MNNDSNPYESPSFTLEHSATESDRTSSRLGWSIVAPITLPILDIGVIVSFRPVLSGWQRTNVLYGFSYVFPFLAFAILVTLLATRRINVYGVAAFVMVAAAIGYFNFWFVFAIWDSV